MAIPYTRSCSFAYDDNVTQKAHKADVAFVLWHQRPIVCSCKSHCLYQCITASHKLPITHRITEENKAGNTLSHYLKHLPNTIQIGSISLALLNCSRYYWLGIFRCINWWGRNQSDLLCRDQNWPPR